MLRFGITFVLLCTQKETNMGNDVNKRQPAFPGEEMDEREQVWYFAEYLREMYNE